MVLDRDMKKQRLCVCLEEAAGAEDGVSLAAVTADWAPLCPWSRQFTVQADSHRHGNNPFPVARIAGPGVPTDVVAWPSSSPSDPVRIPVLV